MPLLEYRSWQKFEDAIQRAMTDCARSGREVADNFNLEVKNKVGASEMRGRKARDYLLSRYVCRLIAMNAQTLGPAAALLSGGIGAEVPAAGDWRRPPAERALSSPGISRRFRTTVTGGLFNGETAHAIHERKGPRRAPGGSR